MTPNHDHDTLFVAPAAPPSADQAEETRSTRDDGAEAMRRLRHPFAVAPAPAPAPADASPAV